MAASSRTPEGEANYCRVCGHEVCVEPSTPARDATCPFCGCLLWFDEIDADQWRDGARIAARHGLPAEAGTPAGEWDRADAKAWLVSAILTALAIAVLDESLLRGAAWFLFGMLFGRGVLPRAARCAAMRWSERGGLAAGAACGWGIFVGPLIGPIVGALVAGASGGRLSALSGAGVGLIVGPIAAAIEGLVVVAVASVGCRLWTGRWLS
jgi:hypothetical protein